MDVLDYVVIVAIMIYARICSVVRYSNDILAYMALTEGRALIPFPIASYIYAWRQNSSWSSTSIIIATQLTLCQLASYRG